MASPSSISAAYISIPSLGDQMDWIAQIQSQNQVVGDLAREVLPAYAPTFSQLDVGVSVLHYRDVQKLFPVAMTEGAHDGTISVQEYLQGLIDFIKEAPLQRESLAQVLFDKTGIALSFVMTDFNSKTNADALAKKALLNHLTRLDSNAPNSVYRLEQNILDFLKGSDSLRFDPAIQDQHTVPAWLAWSGQPTTCIGLRGAYESAFVYGIPGVDFRSYELFENDGTWRGHGFGSVALEKGIGFVYLDPAGVVHETTVDGRKRRGATAFTEMPEGLRAVPMSDLEAEAMVFINLIREDRKSTNPNIAPADRKILIDRALLLAPDSVFVLLEAKTVYTECGLSDQIEAFDQKVTALGYAREE